MLKYIKIKLINVLISYLKTRTESMKKQEEDI